MKIKKTISTATFFLFVIGAILSTNPSYAKETLRLAATTHPDHVFTQTAYRFSEALAKKTKGEIEIKVYPNRQLGNEREQMEMVTLGTIACALPPVGLVSNIAPVFAALQLPFLYDNATVLSHALRLPILDEMKKRLEPKGLISVGIGSSGLCLLMTKNKMVHSIDDVKGLKLKNPASSNLH